MKCTTCFITSDNALFRTADNAKAYAQKRYDKAMSALLSALREGNNGRIGPREELILGEFIEGHFSEIAELAALRSDIEMEPEESGEE